jgi:YD repeat-containing protein
MTRAGLGLSLVALSAAFAAEARVRLPQCTPEQGFSQDVCHDVGSPEKGRLCFQQYAPYVRKRTENGWSKPQYLDLCRYRVTLTTEDADGKPVTRFSHSYEKNGNVLTRTTRAGQTIAFAYDTLNRLVTKTPPSPAPVVTCTVKPTAPASSGVPVSRPLVSRLKPLGSRSPLLSANE